MTLLSNPVTYLTVAGWMARLKAHRWVETGEEAVRAEEERATA